MPPKLGKPEPSPSLPRKDEEGETRRQAIVKDADKAEGKERDLAHGDGGTIGLGKDQDLNHDD